MSAPLGGQVAVAVRAVRRAHGRRRAARAAQHQPQQHEALATTPRDDLVRAQSKNNGSRSQSILLAKLKSSEKAYDSTKACSRIRRARCACAARGSDGERRSRSAATAGARRAACATNCCV
ncbi:hypothetical protein EVAR_10549_1 [Eumeta japonica]|uniref:Uncharacterized protein n=1 Tax=Eumeta variegata TaxID=151549 RepID=A0A4C1ZK03_EUMVA|nr:hypothetical protein EVAR_10549_1 [Eumeta japonica]